MKLENLKRGMAVRNKYDGNKVSYVEEIKNHRIWLVSKNWNGYKWCIVDDIERADSKFDITSEEVDEIISSDPIIDS